MPLIIAILCVMILFTGAVRIVVAGDDVPSPRYVREIDMDQSPVSRSLETLTRLFTANNREARSFLKNVRRIRMGVY
ncbi:MAG: hypothetical protein FJY97_14920 [candidate division Zixibacteria bacterium]|nr:hypothetical protein [candidate division Zixibacteria bacterium]